MIIEKFAYLPLTDLHQIWHIGSPRDLIAHDSFFGNRVIVLTSDSVRGRMLPSAGCRR